MKQSDSINFQKDFQNFPIDWVNTLFLTITGTIALIGTPLYIIFKGFSWPIIGIFLFYSVATGLSITAGYHRLFAHRSYSANQWVKVFFLLFGAAACQNSALKWASDHRNHHRYVDSEGDPYNIRRGFFYAHIGWIFRKEPQGKSFEQAKDLLEDSWVSWQNRYYVPLAIGIGGGVPLMVGYLLGDAIGCFLLAGIARTALVHHSTFLINSLCHFAGRQPYSLKNSSRDNVWAALLTFGEGYHNYHHRFQFDYRNGIRWFHFDPTKWAIKTLEIFGLAKDLRKAPDLQIFKARMEVQKEAVKKNLTGYSQDIRERMDQKIHATYEKVLAAYSKMWTLKIKYRSALKTVGHKKIDIIHNLEKELQKARFHFKATHASWLLMVHEGLQFST